MVNSHYVATRYRWCSHVAADSTKGWEPPLTGHAPAPSPFVPGTFPLATSNVARCQGQERVDFCYFDFPVLRLRSRTVWTNPKQGYLSSVAFENGPAPMEKWTPSD